MTFRTIGTPVDILVSVFDEGGVPDDCENWNAVTNEDRQEAMGAVLHHLLMDPAAAAAVGLDRELLAEFYT